MPFMNILFVIKVNVLSCALFIKQTKVSFLVTQSSKCLRPKGLQNQLSLCVHDCKMSIYTTVIAIYHQLQIISVLLHICVTLFYDSI